MENQAPGPQVLIFLLVFYFLPTILAFFRAHPKLLRIFLFNLFMGYGWGMFGAYYYALSKRTPGLKAFVIFGILSVLMVMIAWPGMMRAKEAAQRRSMKIEAKALPPAQPAPAQCVVSNCHGLEIECAPQAPQMCTMMYGFGDRCRVHAQCGVLNGKCEPIYSEAFQACVSCVRACEKAHPGDMPQAFACEGNCT